MKSSIQNEEYGFKDYTRNLEKTLIVERILHENLDGWTKCCNFASLVPPSLFYNAQIGGRFIFIDMATSFHKHYNSPSQIVALLQSRGLVINDTLLATKQLTNIGDYRFSAYLYPFLLAPKDAQMFKPKSKFDTALSLYYFDQDLRSLVFSEIAEVEVAIRSALANIIVKETGNHVAHCRDSQSCQLF